MSKSKDTRALVWWYLDGWRPAVILSRGRKKMKLVLLDGKVRIRMAPLEEERHMRPIDNIAVTTALRSFRESYKTFNRVPVYEDIGEFRVLVGHRLPRMSKALKTALRAA